MACEYVGLHQYLITRWLQEKTPNIQVMKGNQDNKQKTQKVGMLGF